MEILKAEMYTLHHKMALSLWGAKEEYCGLNVKCVSALDAS